MLQRTYSRGGCGKKKTAVFAIFLILFSAQISLYSQAAGLPNKEKDEESKVPFLEDWVADEMRMWASPFKINKKSLLFLGGLALTTAYLIKRDKVYHADVRGFTLNNRWVEKSSPIITELGSAPVNLAIIGSFYLGGTLLKDDRARETARLSLKSLLHALVISRVLKGVFQRQRPYVEDGVDRWFTQGKGTDYRSFPSGHTTTAWSVATVIAGMYKDKPAVPVICYSLASLAGLSRMTQNKHWASDVLVGAVLGYAIGRFVLKKYNKRLNITPVFSSNNTGISINYSF
jgi:membrane-associated phospholipid phosphatase